jgi:hypothetical protein
MSFILADCNSNFGHISKITCVVANTDKLSYIIANIRARVLKTFMEIEEINKGVYHANTKQFNH